MKRQPSEKESGFTLTIPISRKPSIALLSVFILLGPASPASMSRSGEVGALRVLAPHLGGAAGEAGARDRARLRFALRALGLRGRRRQLGLGGLLVASGPRPALFVQHCHGPPHSEPF